MSEIKDGGPAFPGYDVYGDGKVALAGHPHGGMTLRDYFAAHAPQPPEAWPDKTIGDMLDWRWYYADQMLETRDK